jgi:hypothetical protein
LQQLRPVHFYGYTVINLSHVFSIIH